MLIPKNAYELLESAERQDLYLKLIAQLNRDFQLSNLDVTIDKTFEPVELKDQLLAVLMNLLNNQYDSYLNFIYRVDVPEKELQNIKETNTVDLVEHITFLVLKRIFQKVWLKQNYE